MRNVLNRAMRRLRRGRSAAAVGAALIALGASGAIAAPVAGGFSSGQPAGFDALEAPQTNMVDVYVGGVRVASALARFGSGRLTFLNSDIVLSSVPRLRLAPEIRAALAAELPINAEKACYPGAPDDCGRISPRVAGVIFDEARFRADLFINPAFLAVADPLAPRYLAPPRTRLSGTSVTSGVVSGATDGPTAYGLQNRTVISYKALRLIAETSVASGDGVRAETLAAALDRGPLRYEAGLMYAPTLDFFGEGRIVGASVGTQLDTLANRDLIAATPILVYLDARSRVELYRGARLLNAGTYDAGNQLVDTSGLPDGAYVVTLRIREANGATREERRFFSRSRTLPPLGRPQFQFTAGSLLREDSATGQGRGASSFVQFSYARRLTQRLAVDAAAAVIGGQPAAAAGAFWASGAFRVRGEGLVSTRGDYGVLVDASVNLADRGVLALDLRRAWSRDAQAQAAAVTEVGSVSLAGVAPSRIGFVGEETQLTATASTVWRGAQLSLSGSYSAARDARAAYAYGGSVEAPLGAGRWRDLHVYASAAQTDRGVQGYIGLRVRFSQGRTSAYADAGYAKAPRGYGQGAGATADATATRELDTAAGDLAVTGGYVHTPDRDTASANALLRGPAGEVGGSLERDLRGAGADTRYTANVLVGTTLFGGAPTLAAASSGDSGVVVSVAGPARADFRVLVNEAPVGRVRTGGALTLFLPAYREYRIRLAPLDGAAVDFDTAERRVSLYPGNIARLAWRAEPDVEVYGRALDARGAPLADADLSGARTPTSTDAHGFFQATVRSGADLVVRLPGGGSCRLSLGALSVVHGYVALGSRTCRTLGEPLVVARR